MFERVHRATAGQQGRRPRPGIFLGGKVRRPIELNESILPNMKTVLPRNEPTRDLEVLQR